MSTVPGHETWRDAGLVEADPADLVEIEPEPEPFDLAADPPEAGRAEEYQPADPRPDLGGEADLADVTEQAVPVPSDERDDYP